LALCSDLLNFLQYANILILDFCFTFYHICHTDGGFFFVCLVEGQYRMHGVVSYRIGIPC